MKKASTAVSSGVTSPPARWRSAMPCAAVGAAACRLRRDQDARVPRHLARDDHLLLVSAGERTRGRLGPPAAHVELAEQLPRALDDATRAEPAPARERRLVVVVQRDVLGERERQHEPAPLSVLLDVTEPFLEPDVRSCVGELLTADIYPNALRPAQARQCVDLPRPGV